MKKIISFRRSKTLARMNPELRFFLEQDDLFLKLNASGGEASTVVKEQATPMDIQQVERFYIPSVNQICVEDQDVKIWASSEDVLKYFKIDAWVDHCPGTPQTRALIGKYIGIIPPPEVNTRTAILEWLDRNTPPMIVAAARDHVYASESLCFEAKINAVAEGHTNYTQRKTTNTTFRITNEMIDDILIELRDNGMVINYDNIWTELQSRLTDDIKESDYEWSHDSMRYDEESCEDEDFHVTGLLTRLPIRQQLRALLVDNYPSSFLTNIGLA